MTKLNIRFVVIASLCALPLSGTWGHHSATMFDKESEVTLTGVVKEFQYTNPHSWLLIDVTNEDGTVTTWGFEAEGPSTLLRAGIRRSDFAPGTKLTITGKPMKDGRPAATWMHATRADGKEFNPLQGFRVQKKKSAQAAEGQE